MLKSARMRRILMKQIAHHSTSNDRVSHLQRAGLLGMFALAVISFLVTNLQSALWMSSEWMVSTILPAVIVEETNHERADTALPPLQRSALLDQAATLKAAHMAEREYFAHFSPDGISPWYWFDTVGYPFIHAGENLAVYFTDSKEVVEAWMDSARHRENILDERFQEIGIGVAKGTYQGYETVFVVQLFGTQQDDVMTPPSAAPRDTALNTPTTTANAEVAGANRARTATLHAGADGSAGLTLSPVATTAAGASIRDQGVPALLQLATQPISLLQIVYIIIGGFVLVSLIFAMIASLRRERLSEIVYSLGLLLLMYALFSLHVHISSSVLIT